MNRFFAAALCVLAVGAGLAVAASPQAVPGRHSAAPSYADDWRGWPVAPVTAQHPIRGSFDDPRPSGYHIGIDVGVRDDQPEAGAPPGRTHRVYAVEGGTVEVAANVGAVGCVNRVIRIGRFAYWHADPLGTVASGQTVAAGDPIGWTCNGLWHVHLSEWTTVNGVRTWVNPLRPGGKVAPYVDTAKPAIRGIRFFRPANTSWQLDGNVVAAPAAGTELDRDALSGRVDVRAEIADPQSFRGWMTGQLSRLYADHHPYRVRLTLRRLGATGPPLLLRDVFRGERVLGRGEEVTVIPPSVAPEFHYAPELRQNLGAVKCVAVAPVSCAGRYVLRLFARPGARFWDTRTVPDGEYRITVQAWDAKGNARTTSVRVTVAN
ncbi:MAG: hypothetical protein ACKVUT_09720 [Gaiella sp.]